MDEMVLGYVAWFIIIAVGLGIFLRLITAPYFIWKEDQAEIKRLRDELGDPETKARQAIAELIIEARKRAVKFIAHHKPVYALASNIQSVADYAYFHEDIALLAYREEGLRHTINTYEIAHDSLLAWMRTYAITNNVTPDAMRRVSPPDGLVQNYQAAAAALLGRVGLDA